MAQHRGFNDEFYHDENIIERWNSVVHKKDLTYILGDVTMESNNYWMLDRLNGRKIVVLGNHDMSKYVQEMLKYVDRVAGMIKYSTKKHGKMWLTHCPVHPRELEFNVPINIHGHLHEYNIMTHRTIGKKNKVITVQDDRYINVSAEQIDYTPRTLDELL